MTKSFLDLHGSRGRSLELDFLRIVYANVLHSDKIHKSYLVVMTDEIAKTANDIWRKKYETSKFDKSFNIYSFESYLKDNYKELKEKIEKQVQKNQKGNQKDSLPENAIANESGELETLLGTIIQDEEKRKIENINKSSRTIFRDINWDFYGILNA